VEYTLEQALARAKTVAEEIERVGTKTDEQFTEADDTYLQEMADELEKLDDHIRQLRREALVTSVKDRVRGDNPTPAPEPEMDLDPAREPDSTRSLDTTFSNPWNTDEVHRWGRTDVAIGSELKARAKSAIERMPGATAATREHATNIIEQFDDSRGRIAELALAISSPAYTRAFFKIAANPLSVMLDDDEKAAVNRAGQVARAMSLTDNAGGYLVPFQLDPTVIITSDGTLSEIRQIARTVVATGDVWNGISSGAVSFSWDAEAAEVSDDTTTFAQPSIPIYKGAGFVPISIEAAQDEANSLFILALQAGQVLPA